MTRILVFSDTHGSVSRCVSTIENVPCDYILHAGDYDSDYKDLKRAFPDKNIIGVLGNNDFDTNMKSDLLVMINDKRIFLTHGHRYRVKYDDNYNTLIAKAKSLNADAVVFGHTHTPCCFENDKLTVLNPGSAKYGRTYGVIEIEDGVLKACCLDLV